MKHHGSEVPKVVGIPGILVRHPNAAFRGLDEVARLARLHIVTECQCRRASVHDLPFLATMLGEAAVWRPEKPTPSGDEVMADPRYAMYLEGWPREGDFGLVAEAGVPIGAAWYRTFTEASHGYGFVGEDVPELSIAVIASRRRGGVGRHLLRELIETSVARGCSALSLSVRGEPRPSALRIARVRSRREARIIVDDGPHRSLS